MTEMVRDAAPEDKPMPAPGQAVTAQVGARLRAGREAMGLDVADMARQLRLGPRQVEAIESGDLSGLPGKTFVRGFVRNYARAVNLESAPLLALLDQVSELDVPHLNLPESTHVTMPGQGHAFNKDMRTVAAGLVLVLGAIIAYFSSRINSGYASRRPRRRRWQPGLQWLRFPVNRRLPWRAIRKPSPPPPRCRRRLRPQRRGRPPHLRRRPPPPRFQR